MTDLLVHPRRSDIVVSASLDGSVRCFSDQNLDATVEQRNVLWPQLGSGSGSSLAEDDPHFATLLSDHCGFTGLDCDDTSCVTLAYTTAGMLHRISL